MKKLLKIAKVLSALVMLVGISTVGLTHPSFAHAANYPITGQNYYLAGAGVTSSQTTVPLTAFKTPDGRAITMTMIGSAGYGTLEPQSPAKTELIKFTGVTQNGNGTATLTGVTRGIDFAYPYAASTTLRQAHSGGASFIISNTPNWYYENFPIQGDDNVTVWPAASTSVATRGYVDYVAFNGAGVINATTAAKGVSQLATAAQAAASTPLGSSGASLALTSSIATSTYNSATAGNVIPVTGLATGKIDNNFISTSTLLAATSTINIGAFPAWQIGKQAQFFTSIGTSTFSVPSGITKVQVTTVGGGSNGGSCSLGGTGVSAGGGGGGAGGIAIETVDVTGTSTIQVFVGSINQWSTFGTNGFYNSASSGVGGTANGSGGDPGIGSGGDLNISGSGGQGGGTSNSASGISGGIGGSNMFGGGGASKGFTTSNGGNGGNYGSGGAGSSCSGNNSSSSGGTGTQGLVIVRW